MLVSGLLVLIGEFQFTHPRGVRSKEDLMKCNLTVSIHAPARDAISRNPLHRTRRSFNSRTREGCDSRDILRGMRLAVSIHAPARGAMNNKALAFMRNGFNSRTREGCDLRVLLTMLRLWFQFTHPRGVR